MVVEGEPGCHGRTRARQSPVARRSNLAGRGLHFARLFALIFVAGFFTAAHAKDVAAVAPPKTVLKIPKLSARPTLADFEGMVPANALARSMLRIDRFVQRDPVNGAPVSQRTEAYVGYDEKNLYFVFLCFDKNPSELRAHVNRREDIQQDDQIGVFIDSFNDRKHSYTFFVNPVGVQQDGTFTEGGEVDLSFDTLWYSSANITPQGYVAWLAIPFKSMRFPKTEGQRWGIFFERDIPRNNESAFYPHISNNQQGLLTQEAEMTGMEGISPGRNLQFIPYGSFRSFRGLDERDPAGARFSQRTAQFRAGLDSKVVVHDSLVLDVTANPDFAQVESDEPQTTVNQRFEVFFPEKRPFFQENAGYFETPINLVFTRRLIDPTFGVRLTGKVGPWAIGTLLADDRSPGKSVIESDPLSGHRAYFGIVRVSRDIGKNSRLGVIYTDRELNTAPGTTCELDRCLIGSNRVGGIDGRIKFSEMWVATFQAIASSTKYSDGTRTAGPSYNVYVQRSSNKLEFNSLYQDTAPGFKTMTGFFRRPDVRRFSNYAQYRFRKDGKKLVWHGPSLFTVNLWDHSGLRLEYLAEGSYRFTLKRQTQFGGYGNVEHERLRPSDFPALPSNRDYAHYHGGWFFNSSPLKQFSFNVEMNWGKETNYSPKTGAPVLGKSNFVMAGVTTRPLRGLTVENTYLLNRLRDNFTDANIFNAHIIRSKWNYQFNRELSLRVIGQYNSVLANQSLSQLQSDKNLNADVLVTYLLHPGTAVYVGYNSNLHNYDPSLLPTENGPLRTQNRFINDGRQIFIKVSYLFRY